MKAYLKNRLHGTNYDSYTLGMQADTSVPSRQPKLLDLLMGLRTVTDMPMLSAWPCKKTQCIANKLENNTCKIIWN